MSVARYAWFLIPLAGCGLLEPKDTVDSGGSGTTGAPITAAIEPANPLSTDALTVTVDGATGAIDYLWSVNGSPESGVDGADVEASLTAKDEIWSVVVTDTETGQTATAAVTVLNAPPTLLDVTIEPAEPGSGEDLVALVEASDPDADSLTYTYAWTVNGAAYAGTTDTVSASNTSRADQWTVTVTASDGEFVTSEQTAGVTVANALPVITAATLTPESVYTDLSIEAVVEAEDDDEDEIVLTYAWTVNGKTVQESTDAILDSALFVKHDMVGVTITPNDGAEDGAPMALGPIEVLNSVPTIASVTLPEEVFAADEVTCTWSEFTDTDADADVSTVRWLVDAKEVATGPTISGLFVRDQELTCEVTPFDDDEPGAPISASVIVSNSAPTIGSASISPDPARAEDDLLCSYTDFVDPDGDVDRTTFRWIVDSTVVGTTDTLASGAYDSGDSVTCRVTPSDGALDGPAIFVSVVIDNTTPSVTDVQITPDPATARDTLTCSWNFVDADGNPDQSTVEWLVNGLSAGTGPTLAAATAVRDDVVECLVTPNDGFVDGVASSTSIVMENALPRALSAAITPNPAYITSELTCGYTFSDSDGDADASFIEWFVNGVSTDTGPVLAAGEAVKGDLVECTITPNDGLGDGTAVTANRTISNSLPTLTSVVIDPLTAVVGDTLTCTPSGFADADGDADATTIAWFVGPGQIGTGPTLSSGFVGGDTVTCRATPADGTAAGVALNASIVIDNTAPELASATISPASPTAASTLTCDWDGFVDVDGDADLSTVAWTINGTAAGTGPTLAAGGFVRDDLVVCEVTPFDGGLVGTPVSASVVIGNAAPSLTQARITPSTAFTDDDLTCVAVGFTDIDGDADNTTLEWRVDGSLVGTGSTLASSEFVRAQTVQCTATPNDGLVDGVSRSASVVISNTLPTLSSAAITPDPADGNDDLTCVAAGFFDLDGDPDNTQFSWQINGTPAGTGSVLSGGYVDGDTVRCTATPNDTVGNGTGVSDVIVIVDAPPAVASLNFTPSPVRTETNVTASVVASDVDLDPVTLAYQWRVNGAILGVTTSSLNGLLYFDRDDTVEVTVTPTAGGLTGAAAVLSVVVANTPPPQPTVTFSDVDPVGGEDDIVCQVAASADVDSDAVTYSIRWTRNGANYSGPRTTTTWTNDTIAAASHVPGDQWVCTATPNDGLENGTAGTASVTSQDQYRGWGTGSSSLTSADHELVGAGISVAAGGDVDEDGLPDMVLGEAGANMAYVMTGASMSSAGATVNLASSAPVRLFTSTGTDMAGRSVAMGDIDGDLVDDVVVGAPGAAAAGGLNGRAFVIYGDSLVSGDLAVRADVVLTAASYGAGLASTGFGDAMDLGGDYDGDDMADLVIGAPQYNDGVDANGAVFVFSGVTLASASTLNAGDADAALVGGVGAAGTSAVWAGDVDGDGLDDLLVGDMDGGAAWLAYGDGLSGIMGFADADHRFTNSAELGAGLAGGLDFDGDGRSDVMIGDSGDSAGGAGAGAVFVITSSSLLGAARELPVSLIAHATFRGAVGAELGYSLATGGDVDADGEADLLMGAPSAAAGAGTAYLWLGADLDVSGVVLASAGEHAFSGGPAEGVGARVAFGGDINQDGLDDLLFPQYGSLADDAVSAGGTWVMLTPHY
jgi:hypothetical protein